MNRHPRPIDLSLVLPVHNQADIIMPVYRDIETMLGSLGISYETILVENGSRDGTPAALREISRRYPRARVITAPVGYGSAVLAGIRASRGVRVCYMPSDGQIDLSVFPRLWESAVSGRYTLVKVRRVTRESPVRSVVSSVFSAMVRVLFGVGAIDINGSPRICRKDAIDSLHLTYTDSFVDAEMAVRMTAAGWTVREFPMPTLPRAGGRSTRSWKTFAEFFRNLIAFRLRLYRERESV